MKLVSLILSFLVLSTALTPLAADKSAAPTFPTGWRTASPREEIAPAFSYKDKGGLRGQESFVIQCDAREGLAGY